MLLQNSGVPRFIFSADHDKGGWVGLAECVRGIRMSIKSQLHLHPSTADGILYSRVASGGLGLIRLASHIPWVQLRRTLRLCNADDVVTREYVRTTTSQAAHPRYGRRPPPQLGAHREGNTGHYPGMPYLSEVEENGV